MIKELIYLLLIGHLLGDFYLQSNKMAEEKDYSFLSLMIHSLIYTLAIALSIIPVYNEALLKYVFIISGVHFAIDLVKYFILVKERYKTALFFVDQILHIATILIVVYMINKASIMIHYHDILRPYDQELITSLISWGLIILFIMKPVSIMIKQVLNKYSPQNLTSDDYGHDNAGAFIGILERMMILILLALEQYTMIGLVLTAKSITRYSKITEDPQFSEYYLLGTLLSTLSVVILFLIIIKGSF